NVLDEKHEKLFEAAGSLDITVLDCQKLITIEDDVGIACWTYNHATKEEKIIVGPEGLELTTRHLEFVLRHELLHKYLFKGYSLVLHDHTLMNIALDICINRVLYDEYKEEFEEFCNVIYGKYPGNRQNPLVLAWAGIDPSTIEDEKLRTLYHKIWKTKHNPSPKALYYTLLEHGVSEREMIKVEGLDPFGIPVKGKDRELGNQKGGKTQKNGEGASDEEEGKGTAKGGKKSEGDGQLKTGEQNNAGDDKDIEHGDASGEGDKSDKEDDKKGFGKSGKDKVEDKKGSGGEGTSGYRRQIPSEGLEDTNTEDKFEKKAINTLGKKRQGDGFSAAVSKWFETIEIEKKECATSDVEEFIKRIETTDTLDEVATRITSAIIYDTRVQFYPYRLTRAGYVYVNTGISDLLHRYYNRSSDRRKPRLNIYVDTSPSMWNFKEKEVFLIERFRDLFPTTFYVFAGEVKEFLIDDFIKGKYPMGASTSFDSVIEHFISSEAECAVIFTDGESSVNRDNSKRVLEYRKRLFTVYFNGTYSKDISGHKKVQSDLDGISEAVMQIDVPLYA
ncbi:MAG TPA: hypothetical protein DCR39_00400, partial [Nitrospiraceae bacterium]|nr:hypothetical protein [Nitrospiraceae bacterium]